MSDSIKKMFNDISPIYDRVNNLLSFYTHKYFKAKAISTLVEDIELRKEMGKNARTCAEQKFDRRNSYGELAEVILEA